MIADGVPRPGFRLDLAAARTCRTCHGWATMVDPTGHGLRLCPDCQTPASAPAPSRAAARLQPRVQWTGTGPADGTAALLHLAQFLW